jgi:hypothetical protein
MVAETQGTLFVDPTGFPETTAPAAGRHHRTLEADEGASGPDGSI